MSDNDIVFDNILEEKVELRISPHNESHHHTKLTWSLENNEEDASVINLIKQGCDVNESSYYGALPLHMSVRRKCGLSVSRALIEHGADINARDVGKFTALHHAVYCGNFDAVCMLLYYEADVNVPDDFNRTALIAALDLREEKMAEVLMDYYADLSCVSIYNQTALDSAIRHKSPLAVDLVKAGANVNCSDQGNLPIVLSMEYESSDLFKLLWPKLNFNEVLNMPCPFLLEYLHTCVFSNEEWVECLYLIMSTPIVHELIGKCIDFMYRVKDDSGLLSDVLLVCDRRKLERNERLSILYLFMSLGVTATIYEINIAIDFYGFSQEVEAFIYAGDFDLERNGYQHIYPRQAGYFGPIKDTGHKIYILQSFLNLITSDSPKCEVIRALDYFTTTSIRKKALIQFVGMWYVGKADEISQKVKETHKVPSLLEQSRDQARIFIHKTYQVKKPYQFLDAVKHLDVPNILKDYLLCKIPVRR